MNKDKIMAKIKSANVSLFVIKILISLTLVLYFVMGWREIVYSISVYLNSTVVSVYVLLIASIMSDIGKLCIAKVNKYATPRVLTVSTLVYSLYKYAVVIAAAIVVLIQFLGYNYMTELLAGLGVLTVVIGLGCQSLISDVVAGIFMVFEGNFQVGDVVVVNGWRGTVNEIGLRTTVVEDAGGNTKIINNSSITEIVNNSHALSLATCTVGIEYEESIERVEEIIEANLASIGDSIPEIAEGPYYKGVDTLADSSVNLIFVAKCNEADKFTVQRQLNRQIKLLFDKHNINIPYPQLTVSHKADGDKAN